ncbi:MAG: GrpB family protein [Gemmatimonadaceae bacterium]
MADVIEVVSYTADWPQRFAELGRMLRSALGEVAVRIDHIGSTAVPGLASKPVIDVQISVLEFEPLAAFSGPLEQLGFVFRRENPERTKRYFREPPGHARTHIHVRRSGSWAEQFALLFRDYLRVHAEEARGFAAMKRQLAERYGSDRIGYTNAKAPAIWDIMIKADRWSQEVGWVPGPSDA